MACTPEQIKNLGLSNCNELPGLLNGMIETPQSFVIPAATLASGEAAIKAYLKAALINVTQESRIYVWPDFKLVEDISVAPVYEDTALAYLAVQDNKYRFRFSISENLCLHKAMYTHRRQNGRVFLRDKAGYLIGTLLSNGDFAGLSIQLLNPEGFKFNDGSVSTKSPVVVALASSAELNKNGYMYNAVNFVDELESIVDVNVTLVTATTTVITVDVATTCDATSVLGLLTASFQVKTTAGAAQTVVAAAVGATPGRYTLTGTGLVTGNMKVLSTSNYESLTTTLTVPFP
jgi:hypothetical protein